MRRRKLDRNQTRLNLALTPSATENLESLRSRVEAASYSEVIRRALAYYEELVRHRDKGGKTVLESVDGERELLKVL